MIEGVLIKPLRQICDERGKIMHMIRNDDPWFEQFGEIYFSQVFPSVVKGWHLHTKMDLNYVCVVGMIKLVLFDSRTDSKTYGELNELFIGESNYSLVKIPHGVWNGFKGIGLIPAIIANCASIPHDPEEIIRLDPYSEKIPYDWAIKHQ